MTIFEMAISEMRNRCEKDVNNHDGKKMIIDEMPIRCPSLAVARSVLSPGFQITTENW